MKQFLSFALLLAVAHAAAAAEPRPPNIVFLISDDQAWMDYGFMGHPKIETPHLDRLAARSAAFLRGYVPTALCRPALSTFATGLYAHDHRTSGNDPVLPPAATRDGAKVPAENSPALAALKERLISHIDDHPTLPRLLAEQGYLSHQSGCRATIFSPSSATDNPRRATSCSVRTLPTTFPTSTGPRTVASSAGRSRVDGS